MAEEFGEMLRETLEKMRERIEITSSTFDAPGNTTTPSTNTNTTTTTTNNNNNTNTTTTRTTNTTANGRAQNGLNR